jgi:hypothetical protein
LGDLLGEQRGGERGNEQRPGGQREESHLVAG